MNFTESPPCKNREACTACRFIPEWRLQFSAPEECPHGITLDNLPEAKSMLNRLIREKGVRPQASPHPTLLKKAGSLASNLGVWAKAGFQVVDASQLQSRLDVCKGCEFWDQSGFAGTGSCKKCGCSTQAKLRMTTSKCPVDKWGPIEIPIIDVSQ
jgi:hypothetical protein